MVKPTCSVTNTPPPEVWPNMMLDRWFGLSPKELFLLSDPLIHYNHDRNNMLRILGMLNQESIILTASQLDAYRTMVITFPIVQSLTGELISRLHEDRSSPRNNA
ncbi:MAG: hypothetical protein UU09_C0007G0009 [Microgenomates group bacterium GW2011_GWA2_40_6]|nr:MAG: hypothetical protein UU09_C0007G0009 [Microgenomates group bacterium GW2011_GWA2_40_6]